MTEAKPLNTLTKLFNRTRKRLRLIGTQVFAVIIIISTTTVLVLGIAFFILSRNIIHDNLEEVLVEVVKNKSLELDNILGNTMATSLRIANDPKFQAILRSPIPEDISEVYSLELEMDNQLSFIQNYVDHVFGFYIIGANGMQFKSNFSSPIYKNWQEFDWYQEIITNPEPMWFEPHYGSFTVNTIGQPLATLGMRIIDKSSGEILGVLLADIEVSTLQHIVAQGLGETGHISLYTRDGTEISDSPSGASLKDALTSSSYLNYTGWDLKGYIYESTIKSSVLSMGRPILLLMLVFTFVDLAVALSFVKRITNPLKKLSGLMETVQKGDFNVNMEFHSDNEIGMLSSSFNIMVEKINTLMQDLREEHEKLRLSELKTLEAQINPHFLYNTLESIIWLARNNQNQEVVRLVFSLTNLLRIGLSRGRTLITIQEEREYINNYLIIQEIRYGDEFDSEVSIPEELHNNKILKLILQPLIENAIYHGILQSSQKGMISICSRYTDTDIYLIVKDTGPGLSAEKLQEIKDYLAAWGDTDLGFGLRNVNERIQLYFGAEYGIQIHSTTGEGSEIIAHIPRI